MTVEEAEIALTQVCTKALGYAQPVEHKSMDSPEVRQHSRAPNPGSTNAGASTHHGGDETPHRGGRATHTSDGNAATAPDGDDDRLEHGTHPRDTRSDRAETPPPPTEAEEQEGSEMWHTAIEAILAHAEDEATPPDAPPPMEGAGECRSERSTRSDHAGTPPPPTGAEEQEGSEMWLTAMEAILAYAEDEAAAPDAPSPMRGAGECRNEREVKKRGNTRPPTGAAKARRENPPNSVSGPLTLVSGPLTSEEGTSAPHMRSDRRKKGEMAMVSTHPPVEATHERRGKRPAPHPDPDGNTRGRHQQRKDTTTTTRNKRP